MQYELITDEDYEGLPPEPELQFVAIEAICRRNLNRLISEEGNNHFDDLVRNQYMMTVAAAAEELGIEGVKYPHRAERPAYELDAFLIEVTGAVTRLRLRTSPHRQGSVLIAAKTRVQLDVQIRRLRQIVEDGDIPSDKRKAILKKLDELADEVAKSRLDLSRAMRVLAYVSLGVASGTAFLADAPAAIATITSLVGADQEAEAAERERIGLPPPRKTLPPPKPETDQAPTFEPGGMDDDIPF